MENHVKVTSLRVSQTVKGCLLVTKFCLQMGVFSSCESMVVLGYYLRAKFDSLDPIDHLFTLMLEKDENLWGHWEDGFSFEDK